MAKTSLNKKIDDFFKKYGKVQITKENILSSKIDIRENNEYGNLLHALVNYRYPEKRVLEFAEILMEMGINVNYKGKSTGLTFIHLSLYGYTDESNQDQSHSQEFIIELIRLARKYGLNVNVKDGDSETIVDASIASEIYTGKIIPIIEALGPTFEINESIEKKYNYYLKSSSGLWHNRLKDEEKELRYFIKRSQLNPEAVKEELGKVSQELKANLPNIDYSELKEAYKEISDSINKLISLIDKAKELEIDTSSYQDIISNLLANIITPILASEIVNMEKHPKDQDIKILEEIISHFSLTDLLEKVKSIARSYEAYKEELISQAKGVTTINEGNTLKSATKETEIYEELAKIIDEKINQLCHLVLLSKQLFEEINQMKSYIKDFVDVEVNSEVHDYEDMTSTQLKKIIETQEEEKEIVHSSVIDFVSTQYKELRKSLIPLIEKGIITEEDLFNSFKDAQSKIVIKGKKINDDKKY